MPKIPEDEIIEIYKSIQRFRDLEFVKYVQTRSFDFESNYKDDKKSMDKYIEVLKDYLSPIEYENMLIELNYL